MSKQTTETPSQWAQEQARRLIVMVVEAALDMPMEAHSTASNPKAWEAGWLAAVHDLGGMLVGRADMSAAFERALDAVRAEEREACAEIAKSLPLLATDPLSLEWCRGVRVDIARAIRARGENRG